MHKFLETVKQKAKKLQKIIIFPETEDPRTIQALQIIQREQICQPLLIASPEQVKTDADKLQINLDVSKLTFLDPSDEKLQKKFSERFVELRSSKGLTMDEATRLLKNKNYFGTLALEQGFGDGLISGAMSSTADTVRPALQIIGTKEKNHRVSGLFFMLFEEKILLFADCAINVEPTSEELAMIALDSAETAKQFGIEPQIAMLSFSTDNSANHPLVDKVKNAVAIVKNKTPHLAVDGEMQADAALVEEIRLKKFPGSSLRGEVNVLIFPDLQSGNIGYKLVERLAKAEAIGPILQGLKKPMNDLSRGCKASDISDLAAITSCQTL